VVINGYDVQEVPIGKLMVMTVPEVLIRNSSLGYFSTRRILVLRPAHFLRSSEELKN
jgi:hypothetical protein